MTALKPIESAEAVRPLGWAPSGSPQVLVAVLADDPEIVAAGLVHSRPAVPHADWVGVSLPSHVPAGRLARVLSQEPALRERASARLVLLGHGYAGGIALGLVLGGALTCSGIVGLDIPAAPHEVVQTNAKIRLVQRAGDRGEDGLGLADVFRRRGIDLRCMVLPGADHGAANADVAAFWAVRTFLVELVATACALPT